MADPPWDIHMTVRTYTSLVACPRLLIPVARPLLQLPYGTMLDDEMMGLNVQCLQDDGLFFLWVTGPRSLALAHTHSHTHIHTLCQQKKMETSEEVAS